MNLSNVSIVVPVFNAAETLGPLTERVHRALSGQCAAFELILVDDASTDESWKKIVALSEKHAWISGLKLAQNMGQQAATLIGLRQARYPVAVTMDDDLQHPPESIPTLLAALAPDTDLVYAAPQNIPASPYRMLVALAKHIVALAGGAPHIRHMRSFRALKTSLYPWDRLFITPASSLDGLLKIARPLVRIVHVPYARRLTGRSSYTLARSFHLTLMMWKSAHERPQPEPTRQSLVAERTGGLNHG